MIIFFVDLMPMDFRAWFKIRDLTGRHEKSILTDLRLSVDNHAARKGLSVHGTYVVFFVGQELVATLREHLANGAGHAHARARCR